MSSGGRAIRDDELSRAIEKELEEYLHQTTETVVEAVDAVTDEAIATLKSTSPKRSGRYVRGWTSKETSSTSTGKTKTIHNRTPGLTHLLENGYAKQNGGRVSWRPTIGTFEKKAVQALEKRIRGKL